MPRRVLLPVLVGAGSGLLNLTFLLAWPLGSTLPAATTAVSDYAADGQPWSWVYRTGDLTSALLLLVLCGLGLRRRRPGRAWTAALVLAAVYAGGTLLAVLVPENCTGECGTSGWVNVVHDVISTVGTGSGIAAAALMAVAVWSVRPVPARLHLAVAVSSLVLGVVVAVADLGGYAAWLGWPQRAQILVLSAWCLALGLEVAAVPRAQSGDDEGPLLRLQRGGLRAGVSDGT